MPKGLDNVKGLAPVTPVNDLLFAESRDAQTYRSGAVALPAMGTAHEQAAAWPDYVLAGITEGGTGELVFWYAKTRAGQEAYNANVNLSLGAEFPEVVQTWVVKRADYEPGDIAAPVVTGYTWTFVGEERVRTGDARTDGLFVVVQHTWRDVTKVVAGKTVDAETGEVVDFSRVMVAAGTAGQAVDSDGEYKEVQPLNWLWSIRTTRQAAGLAGAGTKTRTYPVRVNFYWPPVLGSIWLAAIPGPGGVGVAKMLYRPIWDEEEYSGPCDAEVTETWTLTIPDLPEQEAMRPERIVFDGALLQLGIEPCLHREVRVWEANGEDTDRLGVYSYTEVYDETNFVDWPAELVTTVDCQPAWGGYLSRVVTVFRPTPAATAKRIRLVVDEVTGEEFVVTWTHNITGSPTFVLDVSTDYRFRFGFLSGFNGVSVSGGTATVTGMVRGQVYYMRVRATSETPVTVSNFEGAMTEPSPELMVEQPADTALVDATSTVAFGSVDIGTPETKVFVLRNDGELPLALGAVTFTGTDAAEFSVSVAPTATVLEAGEETTMTVECAPTGTPGGRAAVLTIASDDGNENPFTVALTATAVGYPDMRVHVDNGGAGADIEPEDDYNGFGSVTEGFAGDTVTVSLTNVGLSNLTGLSLTLSGDTPDFDVGSLSGTTVTPSGTAVTFTVQFMPVGAGPATLGVSIASNDPDDEPFEFTMTGIADSA